MTPVQSAPILPTVTIKHPTNPKLSGVVEFMLPNAYTRVAIGRRALEIANSGRQKELPRIALEELPYRDYELAYKLATLEFVIKRAPAGLYGTVNGSPVLMPGILSEFEDTEEDGVIKLLYDAYLKWRSLLSGQRRGNPEGDDQQQGGDIPSANSPEKRA